MSLESKLRERIQEYLLDEISSVEEASTSSATPGYQTPYAFSGGKKKDKERSIYNYLKLFEEYIDFKEVQQISEV